MRGTAALFESGLRSRIPYGLAAFHPVAAASEADRVGGCDLFVAKMVAVEQVPHFTRGDIKGRAGLVLFALKRTPVKRLDSFGLWPEAIHLPAFTPTKTLANQSEVGI